MDNFKIGTRFLGKNNTTIEIVDIPENSVNISVRYVSQNGSLSKKIYNYNKNAAKCRVNCNFLGNKITNSKLYRVLNG